MNKGQIMSEREARELLGLPKSGFLDKAKIEPAYGILFRNHQALLNSALTRPEREKESKILGLLTDARNICLGISGKSAQVPMNNAGTASTATWTAPRPAASAAPQRHYSGNRSITNAATELKDFFEHLWSAFKSFFMFVREVPDAAVEIKDYVCDFLDQVERGGIPKIAVVLVLILGLLPLISGCVQVIHKLFK